MTNGQLAGMIFAVVGGPGLLLILIGVIIRLVQKKKMQACTMQTMGAVVDYRFRGEGRMQPVVEYEAGGKTYRVLRKFRGYVTVQKHNPAKPYQDSGAYVSKRDFLHVPMRAVTNLRSMAQQLWPMGSSMPVYYDPARPERAYAEKLPDRMPAEAVIFIWVGAGLVLLSAVIAGLLATGIC